MEDRRQDRDAPITVIVSRLFVVVTILVTFFCVFVTKSFFVPLLAFVSVILSFVALYFAEQSAKEDGQSHSP
jgi:archaellum biogenesis protein FlaJ (TadC family)